jgi:hypothetical protein
MCSDPLTSISISFLEVWISEYVLPGDAGGIRASTSTPGYLTITASSDPTKEVPFIRLANSVLAVRAPDIEVQYFMQQSLSVQVHFLANSS